MFPLWRLWIYPKCALLRPYLNIYILNISLLFVSSPDHLNQGCPTFSPVWSILRECPGQRTPHQDDWQMLGALIGPPPGNWPQQTFRHQCEVRVLFLSGFHQVLLSNQSIAMLSRSNSKIVTSSFKLKPTVLKSDKMAACRRTDAAMIPLDNFIC